MTLDVEASVGDEVVARSWALNEVTVEKAARERMIELVVEIDGHPLSTWGCDGIIASTPTGSTAYAFSTGGPVVWPNVQAMLICPISAHALFARPLVVDPTSSVAFELTSGAGRGVMWCRRLAPGRPAEGTRIEVTRGSGCSAAGAAVRRGVHRPARREIPSARAGLARRPALRQRRGGPAGGLAGPRALSRQRRAVHGCSRKLPSPAPERRG